MKKKIRKFSVLVVIGIFLGASLTALMPGIENRNTADTSATMESGAIQSNDATPSLSLPTSYFTENMGQVANEEVRYYLNSGTMQIGFTNDAVLFRIMEPEESQEPESEIMVVVTFEGANQVAPEAQGLLNHKSNFFYGSDPAKWQTDVASYKEVVYSNLYDGIDLVYRAGEQGLKYDFIVHPGANPDQIVVTYKGINSLELDLSGDLIIHTALGDLRDSAPYAYQGIDLEVQCDFVLYDSNSFGFKCSGWDPSQTLVIDPLLYSTFVGGSGTDGYLSGALATGPSDNIYVTGQTYSADFPTTAGAFDRTFNVQSKPNRAVTRDIFVLKLNPAGGGATDLVYSTFIGGQGHDYASAIFVDPSGNVYITGDTLASDFPTTPGAYDTTYNKGQDAFLTKLNAAGSALVYSTFLGGRSYETGHGVVVDSTGYAYLTGFTKSNGFPTTPGAFATSLSGGQDAWVLKMSPDGNGASDLVYSTFFGGGENDGGRQIAVDSNGNAYATGWTVSGGGDGGGGGGKGGGKKGGGKGGSSAAFPTTTGAFDTTYNGGIEDAFLTKLNSDGTDLLYSTFLGGSGDDGASFVHVDSIGDAYLGGWTQSTDFSTTSSAYDTSHNGGEDAFMAKISPAGNGASDLVYSTFLGGSGTDTSDVGSLAVDSAGNAYLIGWTDSDDFPTIAGAISTTRIGGRDVFVSKLSADGSILLSSTYLGGSSSDEGWGIGLDSAGNVLITGRTYTSSSVTTLFPTTPGAYDETGKGSSDIFIAKLDNDLSE